uniref:Uncharacterized protein n=1 Tax=Rhizophora mucronata TaxID=61149 RepID=A0A2P2NP93_RHIMU
MVIMLLGLVFVCSAKWMQCYGGEVILDICLERIQFPFARNVGILTQKNKKEKIKTVGICLAFSYLFI